MKLKIRIHRRRTCAPTLQRCELIEVNCADPTLELPNDGVEDSQDRRQQARRLKHILVVKRAVGQPSEQPGQKRIVLRLTDRQAVELEPGRTVSRALHGSHSLVLPARVDCYLQQLRDDGDVRPDGLPSRPHLEAVPEDNLGVPTRTARAREALLSGRDRSTGIAAQVTSKGRDLTETHDGLNVEAERAFGPAHPTVRDVLEATFARDRHPEP